MRKMKFRLITLIVAFIMAFTVMPIMWPKQVNAADDIPGMVEGTGVLSKDVNTANAQKLKYGGVNWWVIGYNKTGTAGEDGAVTLLQVGAFSAEKTKFNDNTGSSYNNAYKESALETAYKNWLNFYIKDNGFIDPYKEQKAIAQRVLPAGGENWGEEGADDNLMKGARITDAKIWPLSLAEGDQLDYSIASISEDWWLRTPGWDDSMSNFAQAGGGMNRHGAPVSRQYFIRPAMGLNMNSVLFTINYEEYKKVSRSVSNIHINDLVAIGSASDNIWKVTIKDDGSIAGLDGHKNFKVDSATYDHVDRAYKVKVSGVTSRGTNEWISAVIKDKTGKITHYAPVRQTANWSSDSDTVTINTADKMKAGDKLYVFHEYLSPNDERANFASKLYEVGDGHELTYHAEKQAGCEEPGNSYYIECSCGKYFSDSSYKTELVKDSWIIPATGHNWKQPYANMSEFEWETVDGKKPGEAGYYKVHIIYTCVNDPSHKHKREVYSLNHRYMYTAPACTHPGSCTYMASEPSWASLDGWPHQDYKDVTLDALGHEWKFDRIHWTGDETSGYTKAEGKYSCMRCDEINTVEAAIKEKIKDPTCEESGKTDYTATVSAVDSPDGVERNDTREAKVTNATGHDWGEWTTLDAEQHQRVCEHDANHIEKANHTWDAGKVTRPATEQAEGIKKYTCSVCSGTKTEIIPKLTPTPGPEPIPAPEPEPTPDPEKQYGTDGTPVGPGASDKAAEKAITSSTSDKDIKGSKFAPLKLKSSKQGKTSIKLSWTKHKKAVKYVVYGNRCNAKGKKYKPVKLVTVKGSSYDVKKIKKTKLKKGNYYKFIVVALDKNNKVVSTSKTIHVATKGGKVGNYKSVTVKAKIDARGKTIKKAKSLSKTVLKKDKSLKLSVKLIAASKKQKVSKHVGVRYESSNTKIATISGGKIKAKAKGTCSIYVYAQNGTCKAIKLTVK